MSLKNMAYVVKHSDGHNVSQLKLNGHEIFSIALDVLGFVATVATGNGKYRSDYDDMEALSLQPGVSVGQQTRFMRKLMDLFELVHKDDQFYRMTSEQAYGEYRCLWDLPVDYYGAPFSKGVWNMAQNLGADVVEYRDNYRDRVWQLLDRRASKIEPVHSVREYDGVHLLQRIYRQQDGSYADGSIMTNMHFKRLCKDHAFMFDYGCYLMMEPNMESDLLDQMSKSIDTFNEFGGPLALSKGFLDDRLQPSVRVDEDDAADYYLDSLPPGIGTRDLVNVVKSDKNFTPMSYFDVVILLDLEEGSLSFLFPYAVYAEDNITGFSMYHSMARPVIKSSLNIEGFLNSVKMFNWLDEDELRRFKYLPVK